MMRTTEPFVTQTQKKFCYLLLPKRDTLRLRQMLFCFLSQCVIESLGD
jgi:hypothetical protein